VAVGIAELGEVFVGDTARLRRAAWALQHGGANVARAAKIAGYASQANFSTAFRRHFGLPPKMYRARL
jgi:AraC-like DNA-binding protein